MFGEFKRRPTRVKVIAIATVLFCNFIGACNKGMGHQKMSKKPRKFNKYSLRNLQWLIIVHVFRLGDMFRKEAATDWHFPIAPRPP